MINAAKVCVASKVTQNILKYKIPWWRCNWCLLPESGPGASKFYHQQWPTQGLYLYWVCRHCATSSYARLKAVSTMRSVNQIMWLLCTGARGSAWRNIKSIAECLAGELINVAKVCIASETQNISINSCRCKIKLNYLGAGRSVLLNIIVFIGIYAIADNWQPLSVQSICHINYLCWSLYFLWQLV